MKPDDNLLHKQRNSKSSLTEEISKSRPAVCNIKFGFMGKIALKKKKEKENYYHLFL